MTSGEDPKPTELRGGARTGEEEAREKGEWAGHAREGVVPPELGGSDAPPERLAEDSDLDDSVLGGRARSEAPATASGIDREAGDRADATTDGGPTVPKGAEPDLKDAGRGPRRVDVDSAG
jgi:hypothetical protein